MEDTGQSAQEKRLMSRRTILKIGAGIGAGVITAGAAHLALESQRGSEAEQSEVDLIIDEIAKSDNTHWSYYEQKVAGLVEKLDAEKVQTSALQIGITVTKDDTTRLTLQTTGAESTITKRIYNNQSGQFEDIEGSWEEMKDAFQASMFIGIETKSDTRTVSLSPEQSGSFWNHTNILLKKDIADNPDTIVEKQIFNQYISAQEGVDFILQQSTRLTPHGFDTASGNPEYAMRVDGVNSTATQEELGELVRIFKEDFQK